MNGRFKTADFGEPLERLKSGLEAEMSELDLSGIAYMSNLVEWIDTTLDPGSRRQIVERNFYINEVLAITADYVNLLQQNRVARTSAGRAQ